MATEWTNRGRRAAPSGLRLDLHGDEREFAAAVKARDWAKVRELRSRRAAQRRARG